MQWFERMKKKNIGLTMLLTGTLIAGITSLDNKLFGSAINKNNIFASKEIIYKRNTDSLQKVISKQTFHWNDTTYSENKKFITDTVFGGYSLTNTNFNRFHVLQKKGEKLSTEINRLGINTFAELLGEKVGRTGSQNDLFENLQAFNNLYAKHARNNNIKRRLLLAVGIQESRFHPYAISHAECLGLNQLHPSVYQEKNPFNMDLNVETSAKLLRKLLDYYNGNDTLALTAYNRGRSGLNKVIKKANKAGITDAQGIIGYQEHGKYLLSREARNYAKNVLMYKQLIKEYQPYEGEEKFLARLTDLKKN